jgi:guanylate kinase
MTLTTIKRRGMMLVLSSPSGAGKTTLAKRLLETDANFTMSVSSDDAREASDRGPRPGLLLHLARRV